MVTNFEEITAPLNAEELKLANVIMDGLKTKTITNPVLARDIVRGINSRLTNYGIKKKLTDARLRKIVHYIRTNSLLPLMATSNGYYLSSDHVEIERQIKSLRDRASAISVAANGLEKFLRPSAKSVQQTIQFNLEP